MIKIKEVQTQSHNTRVVRARKENIDDFIAYQLEFIPNDHSLNAKKDINCKAILEPQQGSTLISYAFELERGLYDIYITQITGRDSSSVQLDESTRVKYSEPVMVGDPYLIGIIIQEVESYGEKGIRVHIKTKDSDISLNDDVLYYMINDYIAKYKIPFSNTNEIHFFIKNIKSTDISFYLNNPSFALTTKIKEG